MEPQLRSKKVRWYDYICRMSDNRLPKVMWFAQVKGLNPQRLARKIWNDIFGLTMFLTIRP